MDKIIEWPTVRQIKALERKLKSERLEMFQEAFDVLHEEKRVESDPNTAWRVDNLKHLYRGFERVNRESRDNRSRPAGVLKAKLKISEGEITLGLASVNVVTNNGVGFIIDAIQGLATISNLKWHGSGTGAAAEAQTNSALGTEVGSRVSGTQVEGASANIYKTVATLSYGSSLSITEHGLFSASTAGTMFDRSVFTAISVDTSTDPHPKAVPRKLGISGCDILLDFPVLELMDYSELLENPKNPNITVSLHDVILMTQSCDLANKKIQEVILCPHWDLEETIKMDKSFDNRKKLEDIRAGRYVRYSMLNESDLKDIGMGIRIVDFGRIISTPRNFVAEFALKQVPRLRLCPPYREHIAQGFARFFMRVGLPQDIKL